MDIFEQITLRMAKERIEDAVREAEQMRALHSARARHSAQVRLGSALARLGRWMAG
jgi:hypothetical protein